MENHAQPESNKFLLGDVSEFSEDDNDAAYEPERTLESDEFLVVVSCRHVLDKINLNENDEFASIVNAESGADIAVAII